MPEVKIGDFSKAEMTKYLTEIADPEIDRAIDVLRKQQVHYHPRGDVGHMHQTVLKQQNEILWGNPYVAQSHIVDTAHVKPTAASKI